MIFKLRELLWTPIINRAIKKYKLDEFDVIHFEWGSDFYRDGKFARKMKAKGKKIICHSLCHLFLHFVFAHSVCVHVHACVCSCVNPLLFGTSPVQCLSFMSTRALVHKH